ncbi:MAG: glycosyltransferase family 4 protein [Treponema sp.]|nr:glycosyltransferase family 4 protein [Treponema sp.]
MKKKQTVVFILPFRDEAPVGGYKVVYTYADMLSACGCDVHLVYPHIKPDDYAAVKTTFKKIKMRLGFIYRQKILRQNKLGSWYKFKAPVHREYVFTVEKKLIHRFPSSSKYVATAVETAYWLSDLPGIDRSNGYYLIQDFENWHHDDGYVLDSYRLPLNKAVISTWLKEKLCQAGETAVVIPNGVDMGYFSLSNAIESRSPFEVAFLYHNDERKRTEDLLAALALVKKEFPELHASAFGVEPRPINLPDWFSYSQRPDRKTHNAIYNGASVFIAASRAEGWGLTVCEAMLCGCAIACTDAGGFREFCTDGETALMSPALDVQALAKNIARLISDDRLRVSLAKNANERIKAYTWESSFKKMRDFLDVKEGV